MAHVSYVERDDAPEDLQPTYDLIAKKLGTMLNFFKALAHSPELLNAFLAMNRTQAKTSLDPKLREMAYLRVSALNGCDYCDHYHGLAAKAVGWTDEEIVEIRRPVVGGSFSNLDRDVLAFAEQVTKSCAAEDDLIARLKESLDERQLVELTATVALANFTNRVNVALDIELP
jgi:uncharacterized peroxidase-related enzyme